MMATPTRNGKQARWGLEIPLASFSRVVVAAHRPLHPAFRPTLLPSTQAKAARCRLPTVAVLSVGILEQRVAVLALAQPKLLPIQLLAAKTAVQVVMAA